MEIHLLRADITSLKVDAIVNPTSPLIQPEIQSGRVLVRDGNHDVERRNAGSGPLPVGSTIVTTGGNLLCRFIIHAVVPQIGEGDEDSKLRAATWSSLQRAEELAIESIAFQPMSVGVGFTYERCAHIMLGTVIDYRRHARSLRRAFFCLFGTEGYETFAKVLKELEG